MVMGLDKLEITLPQFNSWEDVVEMLELTYYVEVDTPTFKAMRHVFPMGVHIGNKYTEK